MAGLATALAVTCELEYGVMYRAVVRGWNTAGKFSLSWSNGIVPLKDKVANLNVMGTGQSSMQSGDISRKGSASFDLIGNLVSAPLVEVSIGTCFDCFDILP